MTSENLAYEIAFASLRGVTPAMARELLARIGSEKDFFEATQSQLGALMGFDNRLFDNDYRHKILEAAWLEADFVVANSVHTYYFNHTDYPSRLVDVPDAPLMLYSLGSADLNQGHMVSVVGTRHATPYGIDFVNRLVADLSEQLAEPLTVISGLAFGIDAAAHTAALKHSVPTVGVLAHGLNTIYPAQHRSIAAEIVRTNGLLLTEYSSAAPIHKGNFVARNRIVASLADCVIVAESASKGGALITANLAEGYGRDVFALPGRTSDRYSAGCNKLIANNIAALVSDAGDVIKAMRWHVKDAEPQQKFLFPELSSEEQAIIDFLTEKGEAQLNQLVVALGQSAGRLMAVLIDMEFKGLLLTFPGGKYRLA